MQKKSKNLKKIAIATCFFFLAVFVISGVFAAEHNCTGENCMVCMLASNIKYIFPLIFCVLGVCSILIFACFVGQDLFRRETLVSKKIKLTM